jgi:hypothetical protein
VGIDIDGILPRRHRVQYLEEMPVAQGKHRFMGIGRRCVTSQHAYVKQQHNGGKVLMIIKLLIIQLVLKNS